jgi:hypothetical protein
VIGVIELPRDAAYLECWIAEARERFEAGEPISAWLALDGSHAALCHERKVSDGIARIPHG